MLAAYQCVLLADDIHDIPKMNLSLWCMCMGNLDEGPHPLEELQYCMDLYPGLAELKSAEVIPTKYHPGIQLTPIPTKNS